MGRRLDLHQKLKSIYRKTIGIEPDTSRLAYQPTASLKLKYPCILYKLIEMPPRSANNFPYMIEHQYELTVIDQEPNSALREEIAKLPVCRLVRTYESDNLHHYVFHIYD